MSLGTTEMKFCYPNCRTDTPPIFAVIGPWVWHVALSNSMCGRRVLRLQIP